MSKGTTPVKLPLRSIHCVDTTSYVLLHALEELFDLQPSSLGSFIWDAHREVVQNLRLEGVDYRQLNAALVPKPDRLEVAFLFDSTRAPESSLYGYSFAEVWIPLLRRLGPEKTTYSLGDVLVLPNEMMWDVLDQRLIGRPDFPRTHTNMYYALYVSSMTSHQLVEVHTALLQSLEAYLGYVDCSTWNPLKLGLSLPQVGLRIGNTILTAADEEGQANLPGYPFEESGYRVVGVKEYLYEILLSHRMDNGVPGWAAEDSSMALTALTGKREPLATTGVIVNESRLDYLKAKHQHSLQLAKLSEVTAEVLAETIREKFKTGLIFNLRSVPGARNGVPVPDLDAFMYSVQVEFRTVAGAVNRFQAGLKYRSATHTSELVTFY